LVPATSTESGTTTGDSKLGNGGLQNSSADPEIPEINDLPSASPPPAHAHKSSTGHGHLHRIHEIHRQVSDPYRQDARDTSIEATPLAAIPDSHQEVPNDLSLPLEPTERRVNSDGSVTHTSANLLSSVTFYDGRDGVHPQGCWSETIHYPGEEPASKLHVPGPDVIDTMVDLDRSVTWVKADGSTETHFRDDNSRVTRPDHTSTTWHRDGSVIEWHADHSRDTYRPWDHSNTHIDPHGFGHTTFPGGESWDDGRGGGSARYDDGRTSLTISHADHTSTTTWNDGTRVEHLRDGRTETYNAHDGSITYRDTPFSEMTVYTDKHWVERDSRSGNWTTHFTDGSKDVNRWVNDRDGGHLQIMHYDAQGTVAATGFGDHPTTAESDQQRQQNWEGRQAPRDASTPPAHSALPASADAVTVGGSNAIGAGDDAHAQITIPPINSFRAYAPSRQDSPEHAGPPTFQKIEIRPGGGGGSAGSNDQSVRALSGGSSGSSPSASPGLDHRTDNPGAGRHNDDIVDLVQAGRSQPHQVHTDAPSGSGLHTGHPGPADVVANSSDHGSAIGASSGASMNNLGHPDTGHAIVVNLPEANITDGPSVPEVDITDLPSVPEVNITDLPSVPDGDDQLSSPASPALPAFSSFDYTTGAAMNPVVNGPVAGNADLGSANPGHSGDNGGQQNEDGTFSDGTLAQQTAYQDNTSSSLGTTQTTNTTTSASSDSSNDATATQIVHETAYHDVGYG
jgi:hypothetical protein